MTPEQRLAKMSHLTGMWGMTVIDGDDVRALIVQIQRLTADLSEIEAENTRLVAKLETSHDDCACGWDDETTVCLYHFPQKQALEGRAEKAEADLAKLRAAVCRLAHANDADGAAFSGWVPSDDLLALVEGDRG